MSPSSDHTPPLCSLSIYIREKKNTNCANCTHCAHCQLAVSSERHTDQLAPVSAALTTPLTTYISSPCGYPLGLCAEHRNRIQHSTSEPMRFGCGNFEPKEARS